MSANNLMYKFYSEMTKGYRENDEALFEHGVRSWMDMNPENPFDENDPAFGLFFKMQRGYTLWKMNGADKKINRRRMLEAAKELCELNPKRPYKFSKTEDTEDRKAAAEAEAQRIAAEEELANLEAQRKAEKEAARLEAEEAEKDIEHVFGIVDKTWLGHDKESDDLKISRLKKLFRR